MWLVVGLGNPGAKYLLTRHNIGFMAVDRLINSLGTPPPRSQSKAEICKLQWDGHPIILAKPQTYMNLSGESVRALMDYYKIEQSHLLVIHDDIDQSFPQMKFQKQRGPGGHNGIKSLIEHLGNNHFARLKIGIGRPPAGSKVPVPDYVLQSFSNEEQTYLPQLLDRAVDAVECYIFKGFDKASGEFNQKVDWTGSP